MTNYLSDTITLPTKEMLDAIISAELGDDVYQADNTVLKLEKQAASVVGMEAACLMPSGTMANLASIMAHCPRGSKVLVGNESDIYIYEAGGASVCGGIIYEPILTQEDGSLAIADLERALPLDITDSQYALPSLICIENSHNRMGGKVLSLNYLQELKTFADTQVLPIHMDGARIFNAAVALNVDVKEITKYATSIQFCLSKGLSAPIGSIVAGSFEFITNVKRIRKMLGGGMRQAGIIAAPASIALDSMIKRLEEDHHYAQTLAQGLSEIDGVTVVTNPIMTNIVIFNILSTPLTTTEFLKLCNQQGVIFSEAAKNNIRAVTHRHITDQDIEKTLNVVNQILQTRMHTPLKITHLSDID